MDDDAMTQEGFVAVEGGSEKEGLNSCPLASILNAFASGFRAFGFTVMEVSTTSPPVAPFIGITEPSDMAECAFENVKPSGTLEIKLEGIERANSDAAILKSMQPDDTGTIVGVTTGKPGGVACEGLVV